MKRSPRILVIRRDNIGDLICTTPLLHAMRRRYPEGYIAVLASSYNAPVLAGNPDVDEVFVFLKRQQGLGLAKTAWDRWKLVRALRGRAFDYVLLANGGWRYGRGLGGKSLIGFRERDNPDDRQPDVIVPLSNRGRDDHEVMKMAKLGAAIDVPDALGPMHLFPDADRVESVAARLKSLGWTPSLPTLGLHISSRQPVQRWSEAAFAALATQLVEQYGVQLMLLWSPGAENDPLHPGDDEKASRLMARLSGQRVFPCPTGNIGDLIAALSLTCQMVCSDGGAMHVAAALGKPILCFFGHSNAVEWRPWAVPHVLLQPASGRVEDISVDEAAAGFEQLQLSLGDVALRHC